MTPRFFKGKQRQDLHHRVEQGVSSSSDERRTSLTLNQRRPSWDKAESEGSLLFGNHAPSGQSWETFSKKWSRLRRTSGPTPLYKRPSPFHHDDGYGVRHKVVPKVLPQPNGRARQWIFVTPHLLYANFWTDRQMLIYEREAGDRITWWLFHPHLAVKHRELWYDDRRMQSDLEEHNVTDVRRFLNNGGFNIILDNDSPSGRCVPNHDRGACLDGCQELFAQRTVKRTASAPTLRSKPLLPGLRAQRPVTPSQDQMRRW